MTLRAKIYQKRETKGWIVELQADSRSGPVYFGERAFLSHTTALRWALWRIKPAVIRSYESRDAWYAGDRG